MALVISAGVSTLSNSVTYGYCRLRSPRGPVAGLAPGEAISPSAQP